MVVGGGWVAVVGGWVVAGGLAGGWLGQVLAGGWLGQVWVRYLVSTNHVLVIHKSHLSSKSKTI